MERIILTLSLLIMLFSCTHLKPKSKIEPEIDCKLALEIFARELLSSCPIGKGPSETVSYLEKFEGFKRNKKFDHGNGSIRFSAEDALIYNYPVEDDKSIFLLNFDVKKDGFESWKLFQAIYFFKREKDKNIVIRKIETTLSENLKLKSKTMFTIANESYVRYFLPCGSAFNLKHGKEDNYFIINILWAREAS